MATSNLLLQELVRKCNSIQEELKAKEAALAETCDELLEVQKLHGALLDRHTAETAEVEELKAHLMALFGGGAHVVENRGRTPITSPGDTIAVKRRHSQDSDGELKRYRTEEADENIATMPMYQRHASKPQRRKCSRLTL
ncbi:uncharacterized protein LTR77_007896 [Saxophila tyrrhenica]|uniref:Uncharacterized protein n=1 Tax=Saxophila tyrrhenica TaxID=1690608 RepID=A0AAV9P447_9PEZI|nr:hypothetical protein LTR77_007896 [Saxophila tyrrhenica]